LLCLYCHPALPETGLPSFLRLHSSRKCRIIFETAQFEEVQNNQEHAKQLYSEIIAKYPESEYAKKAKERLSEL
jgi:outer membrane protein assembly factor BamD (BamD/ComL family)